MTETHDLREIANGIRKDIIRMVGEAKSGHPGGSLSCTDILTALYFRIMRVDSARPKWENRDRLVMSKGHGAPALYAILAEKGYFPKSELMTLRKVGSILQGHPDMKKTPGVEASTGSLGQGLSIACGMAMAGKMDQKDYRVYAILGDGELAEGQIWEAAIAAAHYHLGNLTAFLDYNGLQIDGAVKDIMSTSPVREKWQAFGWHVLEIDGHDMNQIIEAVRQASEIPDQPVMIIAHTVKGKGVSFMENQVDWHGTAPNPDQVKAAIAELEADENGR